MLDSHRSKIAYGGDKQKDIDATQRFIGPTIVTNMKEHDVITTDEVYGPLMFIFPLDFDTGKNQESRMQFARHCVNMVNRKGKSLQLFVFSSDKDVIETVLNGTCSNGATVNGALFTFGRSRMGAEQTRELFRRFSHCKPVVHRYPGLESMNDLRYPPFSAQKIDTFRMATEEPLKASGQQRGILSNGVRGALAVAPHWLRSKL